MNVMTSPCTVIIQDRVGGDYSWRSAAQNFFVQSTQREIFYKYLMKFYIIFLAAWAVFAVFYLRRDRSKDAERQRLSDLY